MLKRIVLFNIYIYSWYSDEVQKILIVKVYFTNANKLQDIY